MKGNPIRDELSAEFRRNLHWALSHDRQGLLIGAIKFINAVLFTALWQSGFTVGWPLFLGLGFFAASMTLAFKLEKSRPSVQKH